MSPGTGARREQGQFRRGERQRGALLGRRDRRMARSRWHGLSVAGHSSPIPRRRRTMSQEGAGFASRGMDLSMGCGHRTEQHGLRIEQSIAKTLLPAPSIWVLDRAKAARARARQNHSAPKVEGHLQCRRLASPGRTVSGKAHAVPMGETGLPAAVAFQPYVLPLTSRYRY
jgi:hypothetical protein